MKLLAIKNSINIWVLDGHTRTKFCHKGGLITMRNHRYHRTFCNLEKFYGWLFQFNLRVGYAGVKSRIAQDGIGMVFTAY